jgi:PAS domain S-box-containing protein
MSSEIIITSPDKATTNLLEKVNKEFNFDLVVCEKTFEDAIPVVGNNLSHEPNRTRLIASGGATLKLIREDLGFVPLVNIFPTEYDLLMALERARKTKKKIGLLVPGQIKLDVVSKLCSFFRLTVYFYVYNNWQELLIQIDNAHQDGVEVVVGTGEKIESAVQNKGLHYVSVLSGESTIRNALKCAQHVEHILKTEQQEKIISENIKTIVTYSKEGIIVVNDKNIISIFNSTAAQFFGLSEQEVLGRSLWDLSFSRDLVGLFENPNKRLGYIYQTTHGAILVNKVPITHNQQLSSIMITFREMTKNQEQHKSNREIVAKGLVAKYYFDHIIHGKSKMNELIDKAKKYANNDCNVLIKGESGTGKELIAQSIHNADRLRCKKPFVAVNCASLDGNLLNSELFGYSEGSFTGASKGGKPGLFELAQGGTLFLDEIGKIKWEVQANLLRVLQEKEIRRVGSDRVIPVDVRIIAATNEDLQDLVERGDFREDLYYRLNVLKLTLPPLRERREDIPYLVTFFLQRYTRKYNKTDSKLPHPILEKISNMDWYGNIRQLEHFIERCVVLSDNESDLQRIIMDLLEEEFATTVRDPSMNGLSEDTISVNIRSLDEINSEIVQRLKAQDKLSNSELALKMGISRPTLLKLLNRNLHELPFSKEDMKK